MAKDPRFNFYPDNWEGGTEGFTLEQEGAYLKLIILQSRKGRFTADQAIDKLMQATRGDAAAVPKLWNFLCQKFETDGTYFWSARLEREMTKSRTHSQKQSERAKKRYEKKDSQSGTHSGSAAALPVMELEMELEVEERLKGALDQMYLEVQEMQWGKMVDFQFEYKAFLAKVRGSPKYYAHHDTSGLRLAFQNQLRNAKQKPNVNRTNDKANIRRADASIDRPKSFGSFQP